MSTTTQTVITLTGITWDHSRALPPLVASAQRHGEINPRIRVRWEKRSLHEFGHMPISVLADRFDLIVIDHPFAGQALADGLVLDLTKHLSPAQFASLENSFIGPSFRSYMYDNQLLALPIDAATPCPSWCAEDLHEPPSTLQEVISLAESEQAIMPGFGPDLFLNWLMLVWSLDGKVFTSPERIAEPAAAREATELLVALARSMPAEIAELNPIKVAELLSTGSQFVYCPFAYSYNSYSRTRFARNRLQYGSLVSLHGRRLRSIIGGTGIAISSRCKEPALALEHALYCASADVQAGIYAHSGGQPAHRAAWEDDSLNQLAGGFFQNTRQPMEESIVRPRYKRYVPLQESAGLPLQECVIHRSRSVESAIGAMDAAYRSSLPTPDSVPAL